MAEHNDVGLFARMLTERFLLLPVEEEGRLNDMPLRENFIERVFAYYRWTEMLDNEPTPGGLVKFHTAHKMTREAGSPRACFAPWHHSPKHYQAMGRLVAQARAMPWAEMVTAYGPLLMTLGMALFRSWLGLTFFFLTVGIILFCIRDEEALLRRTLSAGGDAYCPHCKRLLPHLH